MLRLCNISCQDKVGKRQGFWGNVDKYALLFICLNLPSLAAFSPFWMKHAAVVGHEWTHILGEIQYWKRKHTLSPTCTHKQRFTAKNTWQKANSRRQQTLNKHMHSFCVLVFPLSLAWADVLINIQHIPGKFITYISFIRTQTTWRGMCLPPKSTAATAQECMACNHAQITLHIKPILWRSLEHYISMRIYVELHIQSFLSI